MIGGAYALSLALLAAQGTEADYERAAGVRDLLRGKLVRVEVDAQWSEDGDAFTYRRSLPESIEYVRVDAVAGTRGPAFDHARLATALKAATDGEQDPRKLDLRRLSFTEDGGFEFTLDERRWRASPDLDQLEDLGKDERSDERRGRGSSRRGDRRRGPSTQRSEDGRFTAEVRDHDLYLVPADETQGEERRLTEDGEAEAHWQALGFSPDSTTLLACRVRPGEEGKVYTVESSPKEGGRAKLNTRSYALPGDRFTTYEAWLFDAASGDATRVETELIDFGGAPRPRWRADGHRFLLERTDRGHQRKRVLEVDLSSGAARTVIDEDSAGYTDNGREDGESFVDSWKRIRQYLSGNDEILWNSERDGWNHLYLYDVESGESTRLTEGPWVVRGIEHVDEEARLLWFRAAGRNEGEDPYHVHYYRVGLDGTGLVALTEGDGTHELDFSPDRRFLIDTWSRADHPPVTELRRARDGARILELERADDSALRAAGWSPPEVFVAKGRDGETDIWGLVHRPMNMDPARRYPVIEDIYAGPHSAHVPKTFSSSRSQQSMAELGFVVVQIDGMGTSWRSKAFHDVCWKDLKDAGFPDRIRWIQALAEEDPRIDATRVGIYGTSAGGQSAAGAVLFHPDFYDVAVASCGCHDNRMDKASWNEQWMGYPVGPHYGASSNIDNAHQLRGRLMLLVGELDTNVPPESTYRFADALIKAGKDFELVLLPGSGHSGGGRYGDRRRRDFFVRHLLDVEPPERNATGEE